MLNYGVRLRPLEIHAPLRPLAAMENVLVYRISV
jgi:hypothetical protein